MDNNLLSPSSLGYFVFNAADLTAWRTFMVDLFGMHEGQDSTPQSLILRLDNQAQRIVIENGTAEDLVAVGWELDTEQELENLVTHIKGTGQLVDPADETLRNKRKVEKLYCCTDPNGLNHELYFGPAMVPMTRTFHSPVLRSQFVANDLGAGHYVAIAQDVEATRQFYVGALCLRLSDFIRAEVFPGGPLLDATFLHAKTGRHHSAAIAAMPGPKKLHHFMIQVEDMNDVGLAYQRCKDADVEFMMELGHHPNDQMFSFYVKTPSGFGLEFGSGGIVIDEKNWKVKTYSQLSDWGHRPPGR